MLSQILTLVGLGYMLGVAVAFDTYDEGFAKNSMLPLSAAAYADDPAKCLSKIQPDVVVHKVYTVVCDKNNTCLAYTALNHAQKAIVVTFRGSKNNNQILQQAVDSLFGPRRSFYKLGSVGNYFGDAFQLLWGAGIQQDFLALRQQYPDYQVWVTGHSLGAALASLAAGAIASESEESREGLRLVTFGSPRVGDLWYAQGLEKLVPYSYRIVHAHDIIVQLPPISPLFYWHHRQEIYYPGNMTAGAPFRVCKKAEDYGCSNGQINTSMEDHRHYFEIRVPSYCADLLNAPSVADF